MQDRTPLETTGQSWVTKLRYSRSFLAKLILSNNKIKEYYSAIATKLLSYDKVKSRTTWAGVSFVHGKTSVARFSFSGKTLCVYLATDPAKHAEGKFKVIDVSNKKSYALLPSKLKVKSEGAAKAAVAIIDEIATELSFELKFPVPPPISAKNFPTDTFENLVTRGLIRHVYEQHKDVFINTEEPAPKPEPDIPAAIKALFSEDIYKDTLEVNETLTTVHDGYGDIIDAMLAGKAEISLNKKYVIRKIDETWINVIEDSLPALDAVVRSPAHFIEETEMLLPIERTKKVTSRSIRHLSQHTDLISAINADQTVTPSKLLNVFRDDSIMTYENKFVNTLLNRLFIFVTRRYEAALKEGANEKVTSLKFEDEFVQGMMKGHIRFEMELTGAIENDVFKNYAVNTDLWKRVKKLYDIAKTYQGSEFVINMGKAFIRPPVMRTNPILKNKNLRQCLALWEFIEGYNDEVGIIADEKTENIPEELLLQVYRGVAQQYLTFCHNVSTQEEFISNEFAPPHELTPTIDEADIDSTVFDYDHDKDDLPEAAVGGDELIFAIEAALAADELLEKRAKEKARKEAEKERKKAEARAKRQAAAAARKAERRSRSHFGTGDEEDVDYEDVDETDEEVEYISEKDGDILRTIIRYRKSFAAKLRLASDLVKEYYCAVYNKFLSRSKVKLRTSFACDTFNFGKKQLAKITIAGKTLKLYLALDPKTLPAKYHVKDASDVKKYAQVPALLKIRSDRALKNALELINTVCDGIEPVKGEPPFVSPTDFPYDTIEKLVAMGLAVKTMQTVVIGHKEPEPVEEEPVEEPVAYKPFALPLKEIKDEDGDVVDIDEEVAAALENTELSEEERNELIEKAKADFKRKKEAIARGEAPETFVNKEPVEDKPVEPQAEEVPAVEQKPAPDMQDAGGDPLLLKKDVVESMSNIILDLPEDQNKEAAPANAEAAASAQEVPVGGDALELKPITIEEMENPELIQKRLQTELGEVPESAKDISKEKKKGLFSRLFGRKK